MMINVIKIFDYDRVTLSSEAIVQPTEIRERTLILIGQ